MANREKERKRMFGGLKRSLFIVVGLLVAAPALMVWATEGGDWLEEFQRMSPLF
jgi:hypothetical protein